MNKEQAMGDIDAASSPSGPSSPNNRDQASGFITNAIYGSETPISMAQDVTTTARMEQCFSDPVAKQTGMTNAEQLAFRNKAFNAGETQRGDPVVPDFQAGEIEY